MRRLPATLAIKSFAKLNLFLQVLNQRKDKFHNLSTLFARIDLADDLIFSRRNDSLIKIKTSSRQVPLDQRNLCYRAAALLKQELKLNYGVQIQLKKRIPVGAGLGGGSSNAASVLVGLNKFWNLNLSQAQLVKLGAKLGSDVAFFIYNTKFALGRGRGDKIKPLAELNKLKLWFILVYPGIKVSTPLIYQKLERFSKLTRVKCNAKMLTSELLKNGRDFDAKFLVNDLEAVTFGLYPQVYQVKNALSDIGLEKIMMSGSGSAVFALCNGRKQARDLSVKLALLHKSWQVFAVSTV